MSYMSRSHPNQYRLGCLRLMLQRRCAFVFKNTRFIYCLDFDFTEVRIYAGLCPAWITDQRNGYGKTEMFIMHFLYFYLFHRCMSELPGPMARIQMSAHIALKANIRLNKFCVLWHSRDSNSKANLTYAFYCIVS